MPYERSAGTIIFYKSGRRIEYLLIQYHAKYWDFPRGHVEKGESDQETAKREIKEETGLKDLIFIPGFERKVSWFFKKKGENKSIYPAPTQKATAVKPGMNAIRNLKVNILNARPVKAWCGVYKEVTFFLCQSKTKKIKLSFEHNDYAWLSFHEALKKHSFENMKLMLKEADIFLEAYFKGYLKNKH